MMVAPLVAALSSRFISAIMLPGPRTRRRTDSEAVGRLSPPRSRLSRVAAFPDMLRRDRERWGMRGCQAARRFGVTIREYRELEAGERKLAHAPVIFRLQNVARARQKLTRIVAGNLLFEKRSSLPFLARFAQKVCVIEHERGAVGTPLALSLKRLLQLL